MDKSESSSFEDLASAAAQEIEEAKLAEAAASAQAAPKTSEEKPEWQDVLGSKALLKKVSDSYKKTALINESSTSLGIELCL